VWNYYNFISLFAYYSISGDVIISSDDLVSKLSQSGIPECSRSTIISSIIKHLIDSGNSEDKGSTNNNVTGDATTVGDADKNIQSALSNIGPLSPTHPLIRRIQQDTGIQDPQLATQYTDQTVRAMKEHANEKPERMRSMFRSLRRKKGEAKDQGRDNDGSFLQDGYDSF
jgi:hypothetical protein